MGVRGESVRQRKIRLVGGNGKVCVLCIYVFLFVCLFVFFCVFVLCVRMSVCVCVNV